MNVLPLIGRVLDLYGFLIIVYVILGWVAMGSRGGVLADIHHALGTLCEPYLGLFRRILPPVMVGSAGIDFTPFIGLIVLQFVSRALR